MKLTATFDQYDLGFTYENDRSIDFGSTLDCFALSTRYV